MEVECLPKTLKVLDKGQITGVIGENGRVVRLVGEEAKDFGFQNPVIVYKTT